MNVNYRSRLAKVLSLSFLVGITVVFLCVMDINTGWAAENVSSVEGKNPERMITGIVLDWRGEPARNAFVMLVENPYRCALTGADGSFEVNIDGVADAKTLQVSAAGSDVALVPLETQKMGKLTIKLKQQSTVLSELEIGCHFVIFREIWSCADNRHLTKDQELCVKAYKKFIATKQAQTIRSKILTNRILSKEETTYRYIIVADIACQAKTDKSDLGLICKSYCENLLPHNWRTIKKTETHTDGGRVLEKGYRGRPLTENDLRLLREQSIINCFIKAGRKQIPPSLQVNNYSDNFAKADISEDIRLVRLASALNHPKYSNYSGLNATEILRPEALRHHLQIFNHWTEDKDGNIVIKDVKNFPAYPGYTNKDFVYKKEFLNNKPTIVFSTSPLEDGTHPPAIAAFIEYLCRAYGDKINVVYIANNSTYHGDMWVDEFLYYGRNPEARTLLGIDSPALQHETTLESLARITKLVQMKNPSYSWKIYLDDTGATSKHAVDGQRCHTNRDLMLFDRKGAKVGWKASVGVPEETGANGEHVSSYHTPYWGYYILEKNLRILLANDGLYDLDKMDYTMPNIPNRAIVPARTFHFDNNNKAKGWYGFCLNVISVDLEKSEITAESGQFDWNHQIENIKDRFKIKFTVDANTRIIIKEKKRPFDGKHNPEWNDSYRHGSLKDIVKGDLIRVDFLLDSPPQIADKSILDLKENYIVNGPSKVVDYRMAFTGFDPSDYSVESNKKNKALRIWNNHGGQGDLKVHQQITFWGEITNINTDKKTIQVKMPKPNCDEIHGYRFWKEAGAKADISEDTRGPAYRTAEKLAATRRYVEGSDADRIRTFTIDAGVRISRNGVAEKTFSDFKVGDKVSVFYLPFYETQYKNTIPIYPEVILSSSAIKPTNARR